MKQFMTIREVARLGIFTESHLRRLAKMQELPCVYSGTRCLINVPRFIDKYEIEIPEEMLSARSRAGQ